MGWLDGPPLGSRHSLGALLTHHPSAGTPTGSSQAEPLTCQLTGPLTPALPGIKLRLLGDRQVRGLSPVWSQTVTFHVA